MPSTRRGAACPWRPREHRSLVLPSLAATTNSSHASVVFMSRQALAPRTRRETAIQDYEDMTDIYRMVAAVFVVTALSIGNTAVSAGKGKRKQLIPIPKQVAPDGVLSRKTICHKREIVLSSGSQDPAFPLPQKYEARRHREDFLLCRNRRPTAGFFLA